MAGTRFGIVGVPVQDKVYVGDVRQSVESAGLCRAQGSRERCGSSGNVIAKGRFELWRAATTVASG